MPVNRLERVNSLLKRVIGDAMFRVLLGDEVSAGLVTVTGVSCGKDLRNATVRISVFGEEPEQTFAREGRPRAGHSGYSSASAAICARRRSPAVTDGTFAPFCALMP